MTKYVVGTVLSNDQGLTIDYQQALSQVEADSEQAAYYEVNKTVLDAPEAEGYKIVSQTIIILN